MAASAPLVLARIAGLRGAAVALLILTLSCTASCRGAVFSTGSTNSLVLIVVDTLRRDRLSTYGYQRQTSPTLDRLAAEGARADGLSPTSWTKPATASLLTALHPLRHQAYGRQDILGDDAVTLAELLRDRGFQTVGISANEWIGDEFGFEQGFSPLLTMRDLGYGHMATAEEVNRELLPLLRELRPPFFLYVHYIDPHPPYDPPAAWDGSPLDPELAARAPLEIHQLNPLTFDGRSEEAERIASDLYDGEIRSVDAAIGELMENLRRHGLDERLLTVVTSDHGEELGDHGRMGHGHSLYSEVTEVPLIFHAPGTIQAGSTVDRINLIDVLPTVLDLLGVEAELPYPLDGASRRELLRGRPPESVDRQLLHLDMDDGHALALIRGDDKVLLGKFPYLKQLYDLRSDPDERRERILGGPVPAAGVELFEELAREHNRLTAAALPRRQGTIDDETSARLRALGYLTRGKPTELRYIPRRIRPADRSPDGLLGWENVEQPTSCLQLEEETAAYQLLDGWYLQDQGGRWTAPRASLLLGVPSEGGHVDLVLRGINHRGEPFRLRASADDETLLEQTLAAGPFEIRSRSWQPDSRRALVRIEASPAFRPAERGLRDARELGVFLASACLERTPSG